LFDFYQIFVKCELFNKKKGKKIRFDYQAIGSERLNLFYKNGEMHQNSYFCTKIKV